MVSVGGGVSVWRVLVVEDVAEMREFFAACVRRCPQLELALATGTVAEAKAWLDLHGGQTDVLLTDLGLPDGSGLDVIRYARQCNPACEPLVISMFGDEDNVLASIEAGALGYIHKDAAPDDIANTILEMKAGASPISPMIARRVLAKYRILQGNPPLAPINADTIAIKTEATDGESDILTKRERAVLELVARGFSYGEIAEKQGVSIHTVQTHIKNIYYKLAVHSKVDAVREATRMGLLPRGVGLSGR